MHLTGWFVQRARSGMHSDMRWPAQIRRKRQADTDTTRKRKQFRGGLGMFLTPAVHPVPGLKPLAGDPPPALLPPPNKHDNACPPHSASG